MSERENHHAMFVASLYTALAILGLVTAASALPGVAPLPRQALAMLLGVGGAAAVASRMTRTRPSIGALSASSLGWAAIAGVGLSLMGTGALALEAALIPSWAQLFEAKQAMFSTLLGEPSWRSVPMILLVLAVLPGVIEEWLFRGVLRGYLVPHTTRGLRVLFVATLFALYHVDITVLVPMLYVGAMLTLIAERSGGWILAVVAHMALNAFSAVVWVRVAADWELGIWASAGLIVLGSTIALSAVQRIPDAALSAGATATD